MSFIDTISSGASSFKAGLDSLMGGSGPKTSAAQKESRDTFKEGIAQLLKYDVGRTAYFKVEFPTYSASKDLSMLCHSAELPGESTATVTQKIYGVTEKHSVMVGYNDITLAFYARGSQKEAARRFFQLWLATITGRRETVDSSGQGIGPTKETTYNVQYKDQYVNDIKITQYSIAGEPQIEVLLKDAFPIAINQVPLSWSNQNQAASINVTFTYTEYVYKFLYANGDGPYSRGPLGELLGTAIKAGAAINTIQGAFKSGNPLAATSALPTLGMSNITLSSGSIFK